MLVETAIVLPLFLCVVLGILQLALLEQARLLVEYAAFQAARAGIVWHGDPRRMEDAAAFVLAPTACPTRMDGALCVGAKAGNAARQAGNVAALDALSVAAGRSGTDFPGLRVDILNPYWPSHESLFRLAGGEETDFDEPGEPGAAEGIGEAGLLTVRVLYWCELKIPLADSMIWTAWHALAGNPPPERELNRGDYRPVPSRALAAMAASARAGRFFIPLVAHQTMRMQSNFFSRYVRGCRCSIPENCTDSCRAW